MRAAFGFGGIHPDNVRLQAGLEGGALMDVGCYCVSALRLLCGEPVRVSGEQVDGGDGVDIRFAGVMRFEGDVLGTFDCGMDVFRRNSIEVVGCTGDDPRPVAVADAARRRDPRPARRARTRSSESSRKPSTPTRASSTRSAGGGRHAPASAARALGQARTIDALYRAAAEGRALTAALRGPAGRPCAAPQSAPRHAVLRLRARGRTSIAPALEFAGDRPCRGNGDRSGSARRCRPPLAAHQSRR